jgi:carbon monoxide dehydrogenase subunit G
MLRFEGDREFRQAPAVVWARLADARFLVGCVPDVDSVAHADASTATLTIRPGFAFVRGTLEVALQIADKTEPTSFKVLLHSKGIGSSSSVEATLTLTPQDSGTRVHWLAEVRELGGLLKLVPGGLIRGAATKVIEDTWNRVAAKMEEDN